MYDNMQFWDTFAKSGKIDDYIKYKEVQRTQASSSVVGDVNANNSKGHSDKGAKRRGIGQVY